MEVSFVSKNVPLTDGLKEFITSKLEKLSKYSSKNFTKLQIILDVDSRKKKSGEIAVVELVSDVHGKKIAVRKSDKTFYKAFFSAVEKMKTRLVKERRALVH